MLSQSAVGSGGKATGDDEDEVDRGLGCYSRCDGCHVPRGLLGEALDLFTDYRDTSLVGRVQLEHSRPERVRSGKGERAVRLSAASSSIRGATGECMTVDEPKHLTCESEDG